MNINPITPGYTNPFQYMQRGAAAEAEAGGINVDESRQIGTEGCYTCQNRMYVDVSDDGGVSFQAPTRLTPSQAASAVPAHEGEHVAREGARARQEGRVVLENSIRIFTDTCPECGIQFVSGGQARTTTAAVNEEERHGHEYEVNPGGNIDVSV